MIVLKFAALALLVWLYVVFAIGSFNGLKKQELHADWPITLFMVAMMILFGVGVGTVAASLL